LSTGVARCTSYTKGRGATYSSRDPHPSFYLVREVATQLRGRTLNTLILPFSFSEVMKLKGFEVEEYHSTYEKSAILGRLSQYLRNGGFPQLVLGQVTPTYSSEITWTL